MHACDIIKSLSIQFFFSRTAKSIKVCSRNHPKLNECIISAVKEIQPLLGSGVLDSEFIVPALEPLKLDK
jgi:hypothetical protein